jgi:predicted ribosomally synthesized peptide with SipW-like signal peptide
MADRGLPTRAWTSLSAFRRRLRPLIVVVVAAAALMTASLGTIALFTDRAQPSGAVDAGRIFPGVRTSTAFSVRDASGGGVEADRSSPLAFAADGRTITSGAWDTAFAGDRYLQFDMSAPLPVDLAASSVSLGLTMSSDSPSGVDCLYVEIRRISDDAILATLGSQAAPLACVTGTALTPISAALPVVTSTNGANDLRVRVYGRDSAGAGSRIDLATVAGSTPYTSFTLYPVRYTDAADATPVTVPWDLQGP